MSFFEVNHSEANEGGLLPVGDYEVVVKKAQEDKSPSGAVNINMHLAIRNDIDQKFKNKIIFASIWRTKDTGEYNKSLLNTVAKALQIPNGKKYSGLAELIADFVGKTAKVTIHHDEYNGKTNERVKYWNQSKHAKCNHVFTNNSDDQQHTFGQADEEEDVPF